MEYNRGITMNNEETTNQRSRYANKLKVSPSDYALTRAEIMEIRGYEPKKKKAKTNEK
jgi:hypothetical protein